MNAPEQLDIGGKILAQLRGHHAQKPANAADVAALVGGPEADFWAALEQLAATRQVNAAHIQRRGDPAAWLAVWPTGVVVQTGTWTGSSHTGLFAGPKLPPRFPTIPDPSRDPRPDLGRAKPAKEKTMTRTRKPGELQQALADHIAGRSRGDALAIASLANEFGAISSSIYTACRRLEAKGVAKIISGGRGGSAKVYDPRAAASPVAPRATQEADEGCPKSDPECVASAEACHDDCATPAADPISSFYRVVDGLIADAGRQQPRDRAGDLQGTESGPDAAAPKIEFALWDDGRLTIAEGDEIHQLPPEATKRLALLLGVPATEARP